MFGALPFSIALIGLVIASFTDLKTREVPDWLNFMLIAAGFGTRLIYSLTIWKVSPIVEGLLGFGLGLAIALSMYYSGQWGGGDSKALMGLGALLGLELSISSIFLSFIINLLFVGAVYGFLWSGIIALKNRKAFSIEFKKFVQDKGFRKMRIATLSTAALCLLLTFFSADKMLKLLLTVLAGFLIMMLYLWAFVKVVETSCMLKEVKVEQLTEGDWVAKPVILKGKYLCGPKDLGLTKKQIRLLRRQKLSKITIKEGIPFVPSFLIAFVITLVYGNILLYFLVV